MRHYLNILSFYFELSNIVTPFLGYNFFRDGFVNILMFFTHSCFRGQNYNNYYFFKYIFPIFYACLTTL